jgi:hypothetical protein
MLVTDSGWTARVKKGVHLQYFANYEQWKYVATTVPFKERYARSRHNFNINV